MQPSQYQVAIIDAITTKNGNIAINAVAGSGKSSTLKMVAIALQEKGVSPSDVRVIVFGKANAEELSAKFGQGWENSVSTLHSAGFSVLKQRLTRGQRVKVDGQKYKKIAEQQGLLDTRNCKGQIVKTGQLIARGICEHEQPFLKMVDLVRLCHQKDGMNFTAKQVWDLVNHFDIEGLNLSENNINWFCDQLENVVGQGIDEALPSDSTATAVVDFTDMIYVPVAARIKPRYQAQYVLIDECQDLNSAQAELALSLVAPGGRVLAVGDPFQAIMGFSGADDSAYQKLVNRLGAKEMPLSICYRCPKSHIRLVNRIFPQIPIQAADSAVEGIVANISPVEMEKMLLEGDMVLSRTTAPLVNLCLRLLAKGIPATVKGRDIGASLTSCLKDIIKFSRENDDVVLASFDIFKSEYVQRKSLAWKGKDNAESLMQSLTDKIEAIGFILEKQDCRTLQEFEDFVESLFSDGHSPITLCTVHRAKGLEAERVFIVSPEKLPLNLTFGKAMLPWQVQQEENLHYVALTRSKRELYIVQGKHTSLTEEIVSKLFALQPVAVADAVEPVAVADAVEPVAVADAVEPVAVADAVETDVIELEPGFKLPKSVKPTWANVGKYEQIAEAAHRMGAYRCAKKWSQYAEAIMAVLLLPSPETVNTPVEVVNIDAKTEPVSTTAKTEPVEVEVVSEIQKLKAMSQWDLTPAQEKKLAKAIKQEWRDAAKAEGVEPSRILELPLPDWYWVGASGIGCDEELRRSKSVPIYVINQAIGILPELKSEKAQLARWDAIAKFCKPSKQDRPIGASGTFPKDWLTGDDSYWLWYDKHTYRQEILELKGMAAGIL